MAILLRSPERYQPVIEDALRRAGIPAYFSRGTARPDPGGRAFLALLAVRGGEMLGVAASRSICRWDRFRQIGAVRRSGSRPDG